MSHLLTAPSPTASARRLAGRLWSDPDYRSVVVGLVAMLLVHSLLFVFAPYLLRTDKTHVQARPVAAPKQFNIEIDPDIFAKPLTVKPPPPNQFVETNPNANDKVPDKTNNFAVQNQTVAQEKPQADQHNDKPKIDGKKDVNSNQIVTGSLSKPQTPSPPVPDASKSNKPQQAARREQDPLAGYDKMKEGDDGFGSNLGKTQDNSKAAPVKVEGVKDAPNDGTQASQPAIDPKHPRARPVIQQMQTRPAVFKDNQFGTSNIGPIAIDARWSSYGAYLHKMLEAIQIQWDRILIESSTYPPSGSTVTVKFTLDYKGRVTEIIDVQNSSSQQGKSSCLSAVTLTAPYGDWTEDMIAVLGKSQDITIQFYYQ